MSVNEPSMPELPVLCPHIPMDSDICASNIMSLADRYHDFCTLFSIGKSYLGKSLFCLKIGFGEPCVLYAGGFHAMEWMTSMLLISFAEEILAACKAGGDVGGINARYLVENRCLYLIPMVNPDGVDLHLHGLEGLQTGGIPETEAAMLYQKLLPFAKTRFQNWQANIRGVDLNHNYNAGWIELQALERKAGICSPGPTRFGGCAPESEPETRAMTAFCRTTPLRHALAFHSQGELIYWSYGTKTPKSSLNMAEILSKSSGYALDFPEDIASHGGFKDWFILELQKPAFTIEIGKGKNPLPISDFPGIREQLRSMMIMGMLL